MIATIVEKRGWFWTTLAWLVRLVTFGGNRTFLTQYLTTIGPVIGVPVGWDPKLPQHAPVIAHELVHVEQYRKLGIGSAWVGVVLFGLLYLLLPLPMGLAYFRWRFEREAYARGFTLELEQAKVQGDDALTLRGYLIDFGTEQLSGSAYGWAWPRLWVRRWFEENV